MLIMLFAITQGGEWWDGSDFDPCILRASPRPAPSPSGNSNLQLTWPRLLTSLPFLLYPFSLVHMERMGVQTSHPPLPPYSALPSFPSPVILPTVTFQGPRQIQRRPLNQPRASRWWYAAGHAQQTPGLRVNWETVCLTTLHLDCCTETS